MANPSPHAVTLIRERVSDWSKPDADIAESLNTQSVPNPTPQETVSKLWTPVDLLNAIDPARRPNVRTFLPAIRPDYDRQDARAVIGWAQSLVLTGDLQQVDADAIQAIVTRTEPDPSWQPQVSWSEATLGRLVDRDDIAVARQGA